METNLYRCQLVHLCNHTNVIQGTAMTGHSEKQGCSEVLGDMTLSVSMFICQVNSIRRNLFEGKKTKVKVLLLPPKVIVLHCLQILLSGSPQQISQATASFFGV